MPLEGEMDETNAGQGRLLKPAEVAILLGVSRTQIYRLLRSELPCVVFGGHTVRIRQVDLAQYIVGHLDDHGKNGNDHE